MRALMLLGSALLPALACLPAAAQTYHADTVEGPMTDRPVRIVQTNSAGTDIHIFDPATMEQVGHVNGLPHNHGATMHADGDFYYITNEYDQTVDVVDTRTLEIVEQIPLANGPHNLSASKRARKIYVAIIAEPLIQVIDMDTHEVIRDIETGGGVHNTFVTPDGRHVVGGMIGASEVIAIDTETDEVLWERSIDYTQNPFTGGVRPIAFTTNPDGSTRTMLVNVGGWHGFWEFDWETQEVLNRISPPEDAWQRSDQTADGIQSAPSHGIVVLPDQSQVWHSSRATSHIYGWSLPDYEYLGRVHIGNPAWLTATPDSRHIWVGVASHNETAVVDVQAQEVVERFPVGQSPKRIFTAIFPQDWTGEQQ
ncbi:MAG: YncE family protein [Pseudomonadota bacterium]